MLWWAGLRGAIAFALSFDVEGEAGGAIRTTVLVVCVISIITLGGSTNFALERLKIRTGVGASGGDGSEEGGGAGDTDSSCSEQSDGDASGDEEDEDGERRPHWFTDFDEQYLKPVFCRYEFVVLYSRDKYKTRNEWIDTPPRVTSPFGSTRVGLMSEQSGSSRAFGSSMFDREEGGEELHDGNGEVWRNAAAGVGIALGERKNE
jgi:hypothetical protein